MAGFDMNFFSAGVALTADTSGLQVYIDVSIRKDVQKIMLYSVSGC